VDKGNHSAAATEAAASGVCGKKLSCWQNFRHASPCFVRPLRHDDFFDVAFLVVGTVTLAPEKTKNRQEFG
jgi:hypothetical protein